MANPFFLSIQSILFYRELEDNLKTVIIFDENLFETTLCQAIIDKLKEAYDESGNVKIASKKLPIPFSIQWIVAKRNLEGQRVSTCMNYRERFDNHVHIYNLN